MKRPQTFILTALTLCATAFSAFAQTATTLPVGFVNVSIAASPDGINATSTPFSSLLFLNPTITGVGSGLITGVGTNTLSNSTAGWTAGALAVAGQPLYMKINKGVAAGRLFLITGNTTSDVTVDSQGLDLTTLSIVSNTDTYEIVGGQTLLNLFGTGTANVGATGVVGGTQTQFGALQTDRVVVNDGSGVLRTYYYNTDFSAWRRQGNSGDQGGLAISPQAGVFYYRIGTLPLAYSFTGTVPATNYVRQIANSGTTIVAAFYPVDSTIGSLGLELLANWRQFNNGTIDLTNADRLIIKDVNGITRSFFYDVNAGFWKRSGSGASQNAQVISAGSALYCNRFGTPGASDTWSYTIPYTL